MYARSLSRSLAPAASLAAVVGLSSLETHTTARVSQQASQKLLTQTLRSASTLGKPPAPRVYPKTATTVANKSTTAAAAAIPQQGGFVAWYEAHLQANPVPTKMVTGSFLWGLGDAVAQVVPSLASTDATAPLQYDLPRTARAVLFGFAIHAPTSHVHFNFLEWMTQRAQLQGLQIPLFKAFMEQFVYWSWISNSMYHAAMGAMQGYSLPQITQRIEDVLWETQKAQWAFWIPIQLVNFTYTPVRHQLNVVLVTSVVWTALLSAWYPPAEEEKKEHAEVLTA